MSPAPYTVKVQEAKRDALGNVLRDSDGKEIMEEVEKIRQAFKVAYVFAYEDTEVTLGFLYINRHHNHIRTRFY